MNTKKNSVLLLLDYVAVAIIAIAFFVISNCGFYFCDDLSMAYGGSPIGFGERVREIITIQDVFKLTWWWYFHLGGRLFSVFAQYFFSGLLGNKVWFDIVNTLIFLLLISVCGSLVRNGKKRNVYYVLLFALLFWFLCPKPDETLFWLAGSTTHLWGNTLAFVLLWFFLKYKDGNFSIFGKLGLFIMSVFTVAEFIPCVSICGAFVVYYVFHNKKFKKNAVPFVIGFVVGSMILLFAPGNFKRLALWNTTILGNIHILLHNLFQEIFKYKSLWIFLIVFVWGWIRNKVVVKTWVKRNSILFLSLVWSVIAFSVVFRPDKRALFFTETLSLVLFLKFVFDNYGFIKIGFFDEFLRCNLFMVKNIIVILLLSLFMLDSAFAVVETKKQRNNNDTLLNEIVDSGGIVALDRMISSHRMSYAPRFPYWTWIPLADKYGLNSVRIYPFYCLEKYYYQSFPLENVYVGATNLSIRINNEDLQETNNHVTFTINYLRPKKWYKVWSDKRSNCQYNQTIVVEREKPNVCYNGYCYYIIWLGRENVKNLKSVSYTIE